MEDNQNNKETFRYFYSAKQQQEIENIRNKYLPVKEDKMERLRRLDQSAARPGMIVSLSVGILGCLILGIGMCCTMVWQAVWFFPGIAIGIVGIIGIITAYPLYTRITKWRRKKLAAEIIRLTDELIK